MAPLFAVACAAAAIAMTVLWAWQTRMPRPGLADAAWPIVTGGLAVLYASAAVSPPTRRLPIAWMIGSWGARLGVHLLWGDVLTRPAVEQNRESLWHFESRALVAVFFSLPALIVSVDRDPTLSIVDFIGGSLWLIGFWGVTTADRQRMRWEKERAAPVADSDVRDGVCRIGLWRYIPRASDVFELVTWSGIGLFAWWSPLGWVAIACPLAVAYGLVSAGTRSAHP